MMQENQMPGFMTYKEAALMFTLMPEAEAAAAIRAACNYYLYGEMPDLAGTAAKVFEIEKASIDRGRVKYEKQVQGGRDGAKERWKGNQ